MVGCALLSGYGCGPEASEGNVRVAVTVAPLAGMVDRIAPGLAEVTVMIPPGASPVTYEPTLAGVTAAASADLYVSVGHPAFAWEATWLTGLLGEPETVVVRGAEECTSIPDDPHVWLALDCVRNTAGRIARALEQLRPEWSDSIASSLTAFLSLVDDLEAEADDTLGPLRGGSFLVLHPAWGYIAAAHDLEQIAILEHGSGDAGPAALAGIVRRAREIGLRDVLVQPEFSTGPATLVSSELGGTTVRLDPLGRDWPAMYRRAISVLADQVRP